MEYFDVTLMKDSQGLGITIAGYVGKDNTPGRLMVGLGLTGYWLVLALAVKCQVTNIDRSSYMSDHTIAFESFLSIHSYVYCRLLIKLEELIST